MINQEKLIKEYDIIFSDNESDNNELSINSNYQSELIDNSGEKIEILHPEEVRWFLRSNESNKYNILRPFNGYDSLRLETKFQELSSFKGECCFESDEEKIVVKKNLFEVDVKRRTCSPIYWTDIEDEFEVFRGTWFLSDTYLPLTEALADAIEGQHMMQFGSLPYSCFEKYSKQKKRSLHITEYGSHIIIWYGINDVYLYTNRAVTNILKKLKIPSRGQKISRGYKQKAIFEDPPIDITHLCFVVHGIGQNLAGKINKQCHKLKHTCKKILKSHFTAEQLGNFRIEFLPIEWRTGLNLDGGIIDSITPKEFKGFRTILNNTLMDILYYSSSLYRNEITEGLESELNRLYSMFCSRNPYFETKGGKISILAHSLGAVICYDVIKSWIPPISEHSILIDNLSCQSEEIMLGIEEINASKKRIQELENEIRILAASKIGADATDGLRAPNFSSNHKKEPIMKRVCEIDNFFSMGSPLPVFLALRGLKPQEDNNDAKILPRKVCKRVFNIFHPSDPIAYRLEPLVMKGYENVKPIHIETLSKNVSGVDKECDCECDAPISKDVSGTGSNASDSDNVPPLPDPEIGIGDGFRVTVNSVRRMSTNLTGHISESIRKLNHRRKTIIPAVEELQMKMNSIKSLPFFERITMFINILKGEDTAGDAADNFAEEALLHEHPLLENRLDFTLGDERSISSIISLFTAHTSYWDDQNLAKFLLDQILSDYKSQSTD